MAHNSQDYAEAFDWDSTFDLAQTSLASSTHLPLSSNMYSAQNPYSAAGSFSANTSAVSSAPMRANVTSATGQQTQSYPATSSAAALIAQEYDQFLFNFLTNKPSPMVSMGNTSNATNATTVAVPNAGTGFNASYLPAPVSNPGPAYQQPSRYRTLPAMNAPSMSSAVFSQNGLNSNGYRPIYPRPPVQSAVSSAATVTPNTFHQGGTTGATGATGAGFGSGTVTPVHHMPTPETVPHVRPVTHQFSSPVGTPASTPSHRATSSQDSSTYGSNSPFTASTTGEASISSSPSSVDTAATEITDDEDDVTDTASSENLSKKAQIDLLQAPPAGDPKARDAFLLKAKRLGLSYREIKTIGKFKEAESTLRGRYRTITKDKKDRVRKPQWKDIDVILLHRAVVRLAEMMRTQARQNSASTTYDSILLVNNNQGVQCYNVKVPWKQVSTYIYENGGSYRFGTSTCKKKWFELTKSQLQPPLTLSSPTN